MVCEYEFHPSKCVHICLGNNLLQFLLRYIWVLTMGKLIMDLQFLDILIYDFEKMVTRQWYRVKNVTKRPKRRQIWLPDGRDMAELWTGSRRPEFQTHKRFSGEKDERTIFVGSKNDRSFFLVLAVLAENDMSFSWLLVFSRANDTSFVLDCCFPASEWQVVYSTCRLRERQVVPSIRTQRGVVCLSSDKSFRDPGPARPRQVVSSTRGPRFQRVVSPDPWPNPRTASCLPSPCSHVVWSKRYIIRTGYFLKIYIIFGARGGRAGVFLDQFFLPFYLFTPFLIFNHLCVCTILMHEFLIHIFLLILILWHNFWCFISIISVHFLAYRKIKHENCLVMRNT